MQITDYSFGKINIDNLSYTKDVIIYPDHVFSPWWRKEGHSLHREDIEGIVNAKIPFLIVGTGYYGAMRVPGETLDYILSKGIECVIETTAKAVEVFNEKSPNNKVIAALHLTC